MTVKTFIRLLLGVAVVASCSNDLREQPLSTVVLDFSKIETINVTDDNLVQLETVDKSVIFDISNMAVVDDSYVIHSRNDLKVFDLKGKYIRDIGARGKANNEYLSISNFFLDNNDICIYDFNLRSILSYDINGTFISRRNVVSNDAKDPVVPNHVYKHADGFVFVNSYGGENRKVSCLSKADKALNKVTPITGRYIGSGLSFPDDICMHDDEMLYWQPLCDTLFISKGETIRPLYSFDLGEYALPEDVAGKDPYDRIEYANNACQSGKPFAGMIRYYARYGEYLFFVCVAPNNNIALCKLDTNSNTSKIYQFAFDKANLKMQPLLKIIGDNIYMSAIDDKKMKENPCLVVINVQSLK